MQAKAVFAGMALTLTVALAGCASDGSLALSTGSINEENQQAKAQRVDPACVALMAKIDELRKEGTPERLAKVAAGKGTTANVKRDALARMSELDQANSEFQQKCSTLAAPAKKPAPPAAAAAPATAPAASTVTGAANQATPAKAAAEVKAAATTAAAKTVAAAQ